MVVLSQAASGNVLGQSHSALFVHLRFDRSLYVQGLLLWHLSGGGHSDEWRVQRVDTAPSAGLQPPPAGREFGNIP